MIAIHHLAMLEAVVYALSECVMYCYVYRHYYFLFPEFS